MKKLMVLAAAGATAMSVFSAGVANAQGSPNVWGPKFSQASSPSTLEHPRIVDDLREGYR